MSCPFFGVYAIVQNINIPLILQPQFLLFLCLISWAQVRVFKTVPPGLISANTILVSILREQTPLVCGAAHVYISLARLRGFRGWNDLRCKGKNRSQLVCHAVSDSIDLLRIMQPSFEAGNGRPIQFFGIFSSVLLSTALL